MKVNRPDLAAGALAAVCVVGIVVLASLGQQIPDVLLYLAATALGVGGGAALPTTPPVLAPPAPAAAPLLASPPPPAPAPAVDPPTGVFRIATHAP